MPSVVFIQFANPERYPPLEHSSALLLGEGWECVFLGRRDHTTAKITFPEAKGRVVRCLPSWSTVLPVWLEFLVFSIWVVAGALRIRPKIIYLSDAHAAPVGALLQLLGFWVVYHEHDKPDDAVKAILRWSRRHILRSASASVFPNEDRIPISLIGEMSNVFVVRNVPLEQDVVAHLPERSSALLVSYFGSLVPSRLPMAFFEQLARTQKPIRVELMGYETLASTGYVAELVQRFNDARGLTVVFLGAFPRVEMLRHAARADVGLLFFSNVEDANERTMVGASNKIFDYFAAGIPFVCFDSSEFSALSEELEGVYPLSSFHQVVDALHEIKSNYSGDEARRRLQGQVSGTNTYAEEFAPLLRGVFKR